MLEDKQPTDYQIELEKLRTEIDRQNQQSAIKTNEKTALRLVYHLYRYASLTGDFTDYKKTETALQNTLELYGPSKQLFLFRANFNFKLHRLPAAEADLIEIDKQGGSLKTEALKADLYLQQGQYDKAGKAYSNLIIASPSWDNLARLAYFKQHTGEPEKAGELYAQAQDKLSIKQMRHFAWLELQRGIIDLEHQRYQQALEHYLRAERAYSGYWLIREHLAEVYVLLERKDKAIALYKKVIEQTRNPEFISALAAIYESENNPEAVELYAQADALFDKLYQLYPEAAVGHFIESLLKREEVDPKLSQFAILNYKWRPNAQSKYLLVKVYLKMGDQKRARELMRDVLRLLWRSGDIRNMAFELGMK